MKLKDFTANLTKLMKDRPETADYDVVTAKDDEGNGFSLVSYDPSVGTFEQGEFHEQNQSNAVCIN